MRNAYTGTAGVPPALSAKREKSFRLVLFDLCLKSHGYLGYAVRCTAAAMPRRKLCYGCRAAPSFCAFWSRQGLVILVECKDFSKELPGDSERGRLEQKIRNRQGQSTVGIVVSSSGFASTFLKPLSYTPVPGGPPPVIIPIDGESLRAWVESYDRLAWLPERAVAAVF